MRKLMWMGLGFTAACLLGAYLLSDVLLLVLGICLLPVAVGLMLLFRKICWQRAAAFVFMGAAVGMLWFFLYSHLTLAPAREADGQTMFVSAEVTEYGYDTGYGTGVEARLQLEGKRFLCKLYLEDGLTLSPGDRVEGLFRLYYTGAEGQRESAWYSGSGVFLLGYQQDELAVEYMEDRSLTHFPARLRRSILQTVDSLFPGDTAAFAKALLLGDTSGIDYETDTALTASGIVHVVSVSGLHISILFSVLFLFLGRRRVITPILGAGILILAAAVTGFSPSIVRSCLMNGLIMLGLMVEREYDRPSALAFALVVMLGVNPLSITSVGLQLSAASVLGIELFAEPVSDWLRERNFWAEARRKSLPYRIREWICSTVGVSVGATVATAPLTALHFGTVSLMGWLTNLLVLWLINYIFIGIMICTVLGAIWPFVGSLLAWGLSWGIRVVLLVAKLLGSFPLAAVYTESPYIVVWLLFAYGMLAVFLLMKRKRRLQLCLWVTVTLAVAIGLSWLEPRLEDYRVTVVDVGQGQCVLLHSEGRTYMVDCGGSYDKVAADKVVATLHSQGIFRLDGLILTHYDRDHVGAAQYLLTRVPADVVYLPEGPDREKWVPSIEAAATGQLCPVVDDMELAWADASITLFSFGAVETSNESSLCVLFQRENCDILITGDQSKLGEMALLSQHAIPQLDALVVGHHGSHSSTGEYLLEATRPAVALISVGRENAYGHPDSEVLELLERFGCEVRRTDLEGTIILKG